MFTREAFSRDLRALRAVARYAGLTARPTKAAGADGKSAAPGRATHGCVAV